MIRVAREQIAAEQLSDVEVMKVLESLLEHFVYMQGVHGNQKKVMKDGDVFGGHECE